MDWPHFIETGRTVDLLQYDMKSAESIGLIKFDFSDMDQIKPWR